MKNFIPKSKFYIGKIGICIGILACEPQKTDLPQTNTLEIEINHYFNDKTFQTGPAWLPIASKDSIQIQRLAYYISHIVLKGTQGTPDYKPTDSYHLIRLQSDNKARVTLQKVPFGHYQGIGFYLGIDSIANTSLDHIGKGDLDINNGMAWDWATGYKFVLLEGSYKKMASRGELVLHLGSSKLFMKNEFGFKSMAVLDASKIQKMVLRADVDRIFNQPTVLKMPQWSNVMQDEAKIDSIKPNLYFIKIQ